MKSELVVTSAPSPAITVATLPVSNATALLSAITNAASNPQVDIEKMERLFAMHEKMVKNEAEAAFNAAMSRAQSKIGPVAHNAANTQTNSKYAKLAAINAAIVPIYTAEGLSISFDTGDSTTAGYMRIHAIVSHSQGHSRQYHLDLPLDDSGIAGKANKTKVHATGSTNSYGRRYLALMIFNVSTEDDHDGNQYKAAGMNESRLADHISAIEACASLEDLQNAYTAAYTAAKDAKDSRASKEIIAAKDKRKAELQ